MCGASSFKVEPQELNLLKRNWRDEAMEGCGSLRSSMGAVGLVRGEKKRVCDVLWSVLGLGRYLTCDVISLNELLGWKLKKNLL